jgi:hypothetical protein
MIKNMALTMITFFILTGLLLAQDRQGKMGLILMEDFVSQPLNCGFSLWINNTTSIEVIGGFERMNIKDNSGTSFNIGVGGLYHFGEKKIAPFVGARFLSANLANGKQTYSDLVLGLVFGIEYFFSDWISLAGEFQLNYMETDKEYSPTGNAADATIYKTARFIVLRFYL